MNLHYMVEEAFDDLEHAIVHAELLDSTSVADAKRYAQLLDDVIGLHDGVKKEAAPAVGATEAEEENTSIPSIQGDGEKVKNRILVEECGDGYLSEINAKGVAGLIILYKATQDAFASAARRNGLPTEFIELLSKKLKSDTREVTS